MRRLRRWWRASDIDIGESKRAYAQAQRRRVEAEAEWPHVNWLSRQLRNHIEENHFSALIIEAMRKEHQ